MPAPGYHDVFAMAKAGHARIEGDLVPLMANLRYVKDLLALPGARPTADRDAPAAGGVVAGVEPITGRVMGRLLFEATRKPHEGQTSDSVEVVGLPAHVDGLKRKGRCPLAAVAR